MAGKKVAAAFAAAKAGLGAPRPDKGEGRLGEWPPDGDHLCYVQRIEINEEAKFFVSRNNQGMITELDAISIRFWYQLVEDADRPDSPLVWGGAPFEIPLNVAELTDSGKRQQVEISRNRLAGHLSTLLDEEVGSEGGLDEDSALDKAVELMGGDSSVVCKVFCQYEKRKRKGAPADEEARTYRTEFLKQKMSA